MFLNFRDTDSLVSKVQAFKCHHIEIITFNCNLLYLQLLIKKVSNPILWSQKKEKKTMDHVTIKSLTSAFFYLPINFFYFLYNIVYLLSYIHAKFLQYSLRHSKVIWVRWLNSLPPLSPGNLIAKIPSVEIVIPW